MSYYDVIAMYKGKLLTLIVVADTKEEAIDNLKVCYPDLDISKINKQK